MKKKLAVSALALGGLAFMASIALANYGEDNSLKGYVKEYKTLIPLVKAKVKLYKKSGKQVDSDKTNKKGYYKFSDLEEGTYKVKAKFPGYRNPKNAWKTSVSKTVKVDGSDRKNLYMQKI